MDLSEVAKNGFPPLPAGSIRYALRVTGIEPEASYDILNTNRMPANVAMVIIEVPLGTYITLHDITSSHHTTLHDTPHHITKHTLSIA